MTLGDTKENVYEELLNIYGPTDPESVPITNEDLPRLKYTECVIKELLRLFPPGPILMRKILQDFDIGEYTIPKGISVVVSVVSLHRSEKYWSDPLKFQPERFLSENSAKLHPFAYMPFSEGPRNCIGMRYGMIFAKIILATILRKYILKVDKFTPVEKIDLQMNTTLKSATPLKVKLVRRHPPAENIHCV